MHGASFSHPTSHSVSTQMVHADTSSSPRSFWLTIPKGTVADESGANHNVIPTASRAGRLGPAIPPSAGLQDMPGMACRTTRSDWDFPASLSVVVHGEPTLLLLYVRSLSAAHDIGLVVLVGRGKRVDIGRRLSQPCFRRGWNSSAENSMAPIVERSWSRGPLARSVEGRPLQRRGGCRDAEGEEKCCRRFAARSRINSVTRLTPMPVPNLLRLMLRIHDRELAIDIAHQWILPLDTAARVEDTPGTIGSIGFARLQRNHGTSRMEQLLISPRQEKPSSNYDKARVVRDDKLHSPWGRPARYGLERSLPPGRPRSKRSSPCERRARQQPDHGRAVSVW